MIRTFERFAGRRFLLAKGNRALVSVITFIAVAGVAVGVAALIVVLGIVEGIDRDIFGKTLAIYPHLRVTARETGRVEDPEALAAKIRTLPGVTVAEPVIERQVLLAAGPQRDAERAPARIIGVDVLGAGRIYRLPLQNGPADDIHLGELDILPGHPLAHRLGAAAGSQILVTTGLLKSTPNGRMPRERLQVMLGSFGTGVWEFDEITAFTGAAGARRLFGMESGADYVQIRMDRPFEVRRLKAELAAALGPDYAIDTWEERNGEFFQALKMEKLGLTLILSMVAVVASFNIAGTLILMAIRKRRDIGVMRAFGATAGMIRTIFLSAGLTIGLAGAGAGALLGFAGCFFVARFNILQMPESIYNMTRLPVVVRPGTVALILAGSLLICLLAALFPAIQAARLDPVESLRHE